MLKLIEAVPARSATNAEDLMRLLTDRIDQFRAPDSRRCKLVDALRITLVMFDKAKMTGR